MRCDGSPFRSARGRRGKGISSVSSMCTDASYWASQVLSFTSPLALRFRMIWVREVLSKIVAACDAMGRGRKALSAPIPHTPRCAAVERHPVRTVMP